MHPSRGSHFPLTANVTSLLCGHVSLSSIFRAYRRKTKVDVCWRIEGCCFLRCIKFGSLSAFLTRMANERLRILEDVEKDIAVVLQCAGNIVLELSKDKHNASFLDRQLVQFQTSISRVENELGAQIRYLTQVATGQPHEGSTYSTRKDCQMSLNRAEYAKVKLGELGRTCEAMLEQQQQQQI